MLLGMGIMFLAELLIDTMPAKSWVLLMLTGFVLAIAALIYGLRSIRCPRCGAAWLKFALGEMR